MSDEKTESNDDVHLPSRPCKRVAQPDISFDKKSPEDCELFQFDCSDSENLSDHVTADDEDQVFQTNSSADAYQHNNCPPEYQVHLTDPSLNHQEGDFAPELDEEEERRKIGLSVSLHEELKMAILKKADEHRAREAKVLRVSEQEVAPHFLCPDLNEKRDPEIGAAKPDDEKSKNGDEFEKRRKEVFESNGHLVNMMTLTSALASCAAERGKAMNMNQSEENFGSDSDHEEDERVGNESCDSKRRK